MSSYGFVHLPSLLVFIRPQPSTFFAAARDAIDILSQTGDFDSAAIEVGKLKSEELQEATLRLTSLSHEIRHFHDLLLTPYGNQLVRDAFWYSMLTFGALTEIRQIHGEKNNIKLPLPIDPSALPIYGKRLLKMRSAFHERAKKGLSLLEANAIHTQIQQAKIDLGDDAAIAVSKALHSMKKQYSETLNPLWNMQEKLNISDDDFAPIVHGLTLNCLLDPNPMPIEQLTVPIYQKARGLTGHVAAQLILSAVFDVIEKVVSRAMITSNHENEKFLGVLDKAVHDELLKEIVKSTFAEFTQAAANIKRQFLNNPMLLLDSQIYLGEGANELAFPFVYMISNGVTTMQVDNRKWESKLSDPLTHVLEYNANGRTVFELRCIPTPPRHNSLKNESVWKDFADGIAGSLVIAEGANREHPVEGMWMHKLEKRWNISFTPFGNQSPWQEIPAGAIV